MNSPAISYFAGGTRIRVHRIANSARYSRYGLHQTGRHNQLRLDRSIDSTGEGFLIVRRIRRGARST